MSSALLVLILLCGASALITALSVLIMLSIALFAIMKTIQLLGLLLWESLCNWLRSFVESLGEDDENNSDHDSRP